MKYIIAFTFALLMPIAAYAGNTKEVSHPTVPYLTQIIEVQKDADGIHATVRIKADNVAVDGTGRRFRNVRLLREPGRPGELTRYRYDYSQAVEIDERGNDKTVHPHHDWGNTEFK